MITAADDWAASQTTAQAPAIRALVYANPSTGQADAEAIAFEVADRVRAVLNRPQDGLTCWGDTRVLSSMHSGSGLAEALGHESWRVRSLVFEVLEG